jgi:putative protein kinase ArgK-like GTPase of G3E family
MADEVKVLKIDEETAFTDDGKLEQRMRVQFKVGNHGPFFRTFPKEGFSGGSAKLALEEYAREVRALNG